ncbi:ribose ABC transporter ATP-binding protein RbsA [Tepidibacter formicigenes]|jgi:ribose transport system ATP-binding protein|uniref:Ribose transport system ATP-binding protein n=1 Tax=Tepidibacter formicigenes DSM 15518 TaxID=1123349 RepID=A0A1M6MBN2_9FIRM|nr:ribose ABC transporter ATP-binding protein RbsA [Tepidibacter formicigenes]SHJ80856.1 ribose transport system ATP-binding protein [Tepidibacter formicigenes DSM 15518]
MKKPILEMQDIIKVFPGVRALDGVNLKLYTGKVMALLGENGAGKSTLMKILSGVYKKDGGEIYYEGEKIELKGPKEAQEKGIAIIHQELNLIPHLTIGENIFLGREPINSFGKIDWSKLYKDSENLLKKLRVDKSPKELLGNLSIGQQQMVEIAKALSLNAKIIIMDEPTDALTDKETESLFKVINELKNEDKAIVYISHRLKEIFEICDDITVLRDGKYIGCEKVSNLDEDKIIEMMVGRKLTDQFPRINVSKGDIVIDVKNITNKYVKNISFHVKKGEILGIAGLMGAGRTELAKTLYGAIKKDSGEVYINNKKVNIKSPKDGINEGIAYVCEDRKSEGLILGLSVKENMTISSLDKHSSLLKIYKSKEEGEVDNYIDKMSIKTPGMNQIIKNLSGGNQQKVAIAKAIMTDPKVLILDEPTRGVDVGAKKEIYDLINILKEQGKAIIMISSEMPEVLGMSDRIIVLYEGKITGEFDMADATQEKIMRSAVGMKED